MHAAAVGLRLRNGHRLAGEQFIHGGADVIFRRARIAERRGPVVNRAVINQRAVGGDDEQCGVVFMP